MKTWIIKNWMLSYDAKIFGVKTRYLRVANTLMPLLVIGGLINLFVLGFDFWQFLALMPFIGVAIYTAIYKIKAGDIQYLDWEQELQMIQKPDYVKRDWEFDFPEKHRQRLQNRHDAKYKGKEQFVEVKRALFPVAFVVLALILWGVFGFNEPGFPELRGF